MEKKNYQELMMSKPMEILTDVTRLKPGMLFGYKAFKDRNDITAAYPVRRVIGDEIQFVLCYREDGRAIIDNTWLNPHFEIYVNVPPIIVGMDVNNPTTFQNELSEFFTP